MTDTTMETSTAVSFFSFAGHSFGLVESHDFLVSLPYNLAQAWLTLAFSSLKDFVSN